MTNNLRTEPEFDNSKVYIQRCTKTGKGVFAKNNILKGDLIERFPVLPLEFRTKYQNDKGVIHHALVKDDCTCAECAKHGYVMYMASGYGSLYGFTSENAANATYKIYYDNFYGEVIATQDIAANSEIQISQSESYTYKQYLINYRLFNNNNNEN